MRATGAAIASARRIEWVSIRCPLEGHRERGRGSSGPAVWRVSQWLPSSTLLKWKPGKHQVAYGETGRFRQVTAPAIPFQQSGRAGLSVLGTHSSQTLLRASMHPPDADPWRTFSRDSMHTGVETIPPSTIASTSACPETGCTGAAGAVIAADTRITGRIVVIGLPPRPSRSASRRALDRAP